MPTISISIPQDLKDEIDRLKEEEYSGNRSEAVQELLRQGLEVDDLQDRLDAREARIDQLEEQLARRSQIEEKVDVLAKRVGDQDQRDSDPSPPWPVRWWRWARSRGNEGETAD